jgi:hypothetical protein
MFLSQDMGDEMHRGIKRLAISAVVVAAVLFVLVSAWGWLTPLAKYFNASLALAIDNSRRLGAALPSLTNLREHLDISKFRSYLKDTALVALLFLLLLWRALLIKRS